MAGGSIKFDAGEDKGEHDDNEDVNEGDGKEEALPTGVDDDDDNSFSSLSFSSLSLLSLSS
jgi:hypothetical protein